MSEELSDRLLAVMGRVLRGDDGEMLDIQRGRDERWDSLAHASLVAAVESTFAVMLTTDEIIDFDTFAAGIRILAAKGGTGSAKVLVTDLDDTLWGGVLAETEDIDVTGPYQMYAHLLGKVQETGGLIAAVTKNDEDAAFNDKIRKALDKVSLRAEQIVAVVSSWEAKSVQIAQLAEHLNLNPADFVFVDNNPVEIAEVQAALPMVECLQFSPDERHLPSLFAEISRRFDVFTKRVTDEDRNRTTYYRRVLSEIGTMQPARASGADITPFLKDLRMRLDITRRESDMTRWLQLLNKTNQFNLNGRQLNEGNMLAEWSQGAEAWSVILSDKNGSHGEIIACLISTRGEWKAVSALAMSCRVFGRRVEHAFFRVLCDLYPNQKLIVEYAKTERNEPMMRFLEEPGFVEDGEGLLLDTAVFADTHSADTDLFEIDVRVEVLTGAGI